LQAELEQKQKLFNEQQAEKLEKVVSAFIEDITKSGFDKVLVKQMVVSKLTRKNKRRKV
jgi:DNA-binding transcriptional regulator YhcF (GntR family)